jgi:hypothetical protein
LAKPEEPEAVKLVCATLSSDPAVLRRALVALSERFGTLDYESEGYRFDLTSYYETEMGGDLERRLLSFRDTVPPDLLVEAKALANRVEDTLRSPRGRRVNLDVGYLDAHKLVLASCKAGRPKVYLSQGVYADPIAFYAKGRFSYPEGSFADFRSGRYDRDLLEIRARYAAGRRSVSSEEGVPCRPPPSYNTKQTRGE